MVEGAAPGARNIATPDGHSRDGTLEALRRFKAEEDPDGKVVIVTAEDAGHPDGFWPGEKDEQSRAYATRATGNYLWQVDIDEFYLADDMERVMAMLVADPTIEAMTFRQITFWGGLEYVCDGWYLRRGAAYYHRLFRWRPDYTYATHRPPTVLDETGRDLRTGRWLDASATVAAGIHLYHYSLLLPKQVIEKCDYYAQRRVGQTDRRDRMGQRGLAVGSTVHSGSTTSMPTRAGSSATAGPTRTRCDGWSRSCAPAEARSHCVPPPTSSASWTRPGTGSVALSSSGWTHGTSARAVSDAGRGAP